MLDVHFPRVVYKKLLGGEVTLSDLSELQPEVVRGFTQMLAWDEEEEGATIEDVFCLSSEGTYKSLDGTPVTVDLKENGSGIDVTMENREEYVQLYLNWYVTLLVEKQYATFARGFWTVVDGFTLRLFSPSELELLVEGEQVINFKALENTGTVYEGGFTKSCVAVRRFWDVVHEFDDDTKRKLLRFVTGASRPPMGGLGRLEPKLKIQRNGPDSELLPTSATCFNTLLLPEYSTRGKLKRKLLVAVENASGFGLE